MFKFRKYYKYRPFVEIGEAAAINYASANKL